VYKNKIRGDIKANDGDDDDDDDDDDCERLLYILPSTSPNILHTIAM
jgi:hypothetical protein